MLACRPSSEMSVIRSASARCVSEGWLANRSSKVSAIRPTVASRCAAMVDNLCAIVEQRLVRPEGVEPPAYRFEACRSIQLSYGRPRPLYRDRLVCPASRRDDADHVFEQTRSPARANCRSAGADDVGGTFAVPRAARVRVRACVWARRCHACGCARITFCPGAIISRRSPRTPRLRSPSGRASAR